MLPEEGKDLLCVWILTPTQISELLRGGTMTTCVGVGDRSSRMMRLCAMTQEVQDLSEDTERTCPK